MWSNNKSIPLFGYKRENNYDRKDPALNTLGEVSNIVYYLDIIVEYG
jgi:hypothetical protein